MRLTEGQAASGKIVFADQLRGIAALLVVLNHYTGVFWLSRGIVAAYVFAPPMDGPVPGYIRHIVALPFNPGALGVAIFFMISGFVIPFSFRHHTRTNFLLARALRIYPTYLAALAIGLAARALSAFYWGTGFHVRLPVILGNALLVNDLLALPTIDLVNWTLAAELKFYLLMALAFPLLLRWRVWFVLGVGAASLIAINAAQGLMPYLPGRLQFVAGTLCGEAACVAFMLMGTLFFLNMRGLLSTATLFGGLAAGLAIFAACWWCGPADSPLAGVVGNYICGSVIFGLCFLARHRFVRSRLLRVLSAISYPLYAVHAMAGFSLLAVLVGGLSVSFPVAVCATVAAVVLLAGAIHVAIERPSIALGRSLSPVRLPATGMEGETVRNL